MQQASQKLLDDATSIHCQPTFQSKKYFCKMAARNHCKQEDERIC